MTSPDLDLNGITEFAEVDERRRDLREQRARALQEVKRLEAEFRLAASKREAVAERAAVRAILSGHEPPATPDLDGQLAQARRRHELLHRAVREFEAEEYAPARARAVRMISERFVDEHRSAVVEIAVAIERLELALEHEKGIRQRLERAGCWDPSTIPNATVPVRAPLEQWKMWARRRYLERPATEAAA